MSQNRSSAVMQQRSEPHDSLDDFPTPSWGTRALIEHIIKPRIPLGTGAAWDPAANRGYMVRPLREYFVRVFASDVHDYGAQFAVSDFLFPGAPFIERPEWIITNPPFLLAEQFIARAREIALVGCAMLVRSAFLEGAARYRNLFQKTPPTIIAQFAERIILTKGIVRDPNKPYMDEATGKMKRPSTATAYCWLVWVRARPAEPFQWIPPCRTKLERDGDYPPPT